MKINTAGRLLLCIVWVKELRKLIKVEINRLIAQAYYIEFQKNSVFLGNKVGENEFYN